MSDPFKDKESIDRKEKFLKAYEELCGHYGVRLMSYPTLVPSGQNGFNLAASMVPIDMKNQDIPSPIQNENGSIL